MKEFMLIYVGGDPEWKTKTPPEDFQAIMGRWGAWMENLGKKDQLVTGGSPLEYSGKSIADGVVTDITSAEFKELVSGYSIIRAKDIDEATALAKECPIFETPNVVVQVREVTQMG